MVNLNRASLVGALVEIRLSAVQNHEGLVGALPRRGLGSFGLVAGSRIMTTRQGGVASTPP